MGIDATLITVDIIEKPVQIKQQGQTAETSIAR